MTTCARLLATIAGVAVAVAVHAQTVGTVRVAGRVVNRDGAPLGSAVVRIASSAVDREVVTDPDGGFGFTDLAPATYTLSATMTGFQSANRTVVASVPGAINIDFRLDAACLSTIRADDWGLPTNIAAADAILYVRITDAGRPTRLTSSGYCVEGEEHRATVVAAIKSPALRSDVIRLVRAGGRYNIGDEYILFLHVHPSGAFVDFRDHAFPVEQGRVRWTRTDLPGVADGSPVRQVLEGLRNTLSMIR
jgi:hypothetical protein